MRRSRRDADEELERQAGLVGVAAEVFGTDVLEGRAERIGSLENGPRRTIVHVNRVDHMAPAEYPRRVTMARELDEAAAMADNGLPLPGTLAHAKLATAIDAGNVALANEIRERVKAMAPELRVAARAQEAIETERRIAGIEIQAVRFRRAREKRERKAAKRRAHHG